MLTKILKNKKGFTLIEVLVSITIIVMLTGLFLANYHSANQRSILNIFIQEMASDIRLMQNYGLSSLEYEGSVPLGGWGIYLNKVSNNYILFADIDNDKEYNPPGEMYKTVNFPDGVIVEDIIGDTMSGKSSISITFVPPRPTVNIGDIFNSYNDLMVILKDDKNNTIKSINVNYFGLVDVMRN